MGFALCVGVDLVVGVVVVVVGVRGCPEFWVVVLYCLICIFLGVCGLVGVYCIGLGNFDYNFVGRRVVLLCVVHFLLVLLGFCSRFESLLVTLIVCHWEEKYVLFFVCFVLGVYIVICGIDRCLVVVVLLWLVFSILFRVQLHIAGSLFLYF